MNYKKKLELLLNKVRKLREEGYTDTDIADMLGMHQTYFSTHYPKIENGLHNPMLQTLNRYLSNLEKFEEAGDLQDKASKILNLIGTHEEWSIHNRAVVKEAKELWITIVTPYENKIVFDGEFNNTIYGTKKEVLFLLSYIKERYNPIHFNIARGKDLIGEGYIY